MSTDAATATVPARSAFADGARSIVPMALAALPFGIVFGVAAAESTVGRWIGLSASWIILAGASQLSLLSMIDDGAAWPAAVGTALVINLRMALYSTALAPSFREFPRRWRMALAYPLTDQLGAMAVLHFRVERDPTRRRLWYSGAAVVFLAAWWIGSVFGLLVGGSLPESLQISFAVPAMFIAILIPSIVDVPSLAAALVGAGVAFAASGLPNGLHIIVGAVAGIAAGRLVYERRLAGGVTQGVRHHVSQPPDGDGDGDVGGAP